MYGRLEQMTGDEDCRAYIDSVRPYFVRGQLCAGETKQNFPEPRMGALPLQCLIEQKNNVWHRNWAFWNSARKNVRCLSSGKRKTDKSISTEMENLWLPGPPHVLSRCCFRWKCSLHAEGATKVLLRKQNTAQEHAGTCLSQKETINRPPALQSPRGITYVIRFSTKYIESRCGQSRIPVFPLHPREKYGIIALPPGSDFFGRAGC